MKERSITNLAKAQEKQRVMRELGTTPEHLDPAQKIKRNPKSRKLAIHANCWDCTCQQRIEIRLCPIPDCPLYEFRPYKTKNEATGTTNEL